MPLLFLPFAASSAFGGFLCDVICSWPELILHSNAEVYALLALARAVMYLFCETIKCITRIGSTWLICMGSWYIAFKQKVKLYTWNKKVWSSVVIWKWMKPREYNNWASYLIR
jgi:uncharacterized membrane protein YeiH